MDLSIIFTCSRICPSTNRDTLPLLWRLIRVHNSPRTPCPHSACWHRQAVFWNYLITHLAGGWWSHREALKWSSLYSRSVRGLSLTCSHRRACTHTHRNLKYRFSFTLFYIVADWVFVTNTKERFSYVCHQSWKLLWLLFKRTLHCSSLNYTNIGIW